mmetsp:Transcript_43216/g.136653  ORF Transcript_43216/g.136653 Transcript_43216/m.136653 type:complete len:248 (-) Transcript_43216:3246-3989(-)
MISFSPTSVAVFVPILPQHLAPTVGLHESYQADGRSFTSLLPPILPAPFPVGATDNLLPLEEVHRHASFTRRRASVVARSCFLREGSSDRSSEPLQERTQFDLHRVFDAYTNSVVHVEDARGECPVVGLGVLLERVVHVYGDLMAAFPTKEAWILFEDGDEVVELTLDLHRVADARTSLLRHEGLTVEEVVTGQLLLGLLLACLRFWLGCLRPGRRRSVGLDSYLTERRQARRLLCDADRGLQRLLA